MTYKNEKKEDKPGVIRLVGFESQPNELHSEIMRMKKTLVSSRRLSRLVKSWSSAANEVCQLFTLVSLRPVGAEEICAMTEIAR